MSSHDDTPLWSAFCRCEELTQREGMEMCLLLMKHFEGVDEAQFETDLRQKTHVLRIWKKHELVGFSTLKAYSKEVEDQTMNFLYSGDTIMSPECWNSPILARRWIAMVLEIQRSMPEGRCWWLLLSAGFRTYRYLPVFWRHFWPRFDEPMPSDIRRLRDQLARENFGECFEPNAGIVRFPFPHRLRSELAEVPDTKRKDEHVAYFLDQNPGWIAGDEWVCLTEISETNLTPVGRRMVRGLNQ